VIDIDVPFKTLEDGTVLIEVDGIKIFLKEEIVPGLVYKVILRAKNYNLVCTVEFDVMRKTVISVSCNGFKSDKVKSVIENYVKLVGADYSKWRR
jgi:hypothetical protein